MSDAADSEREKLVQAILRKPVQPTLEDAVAVVRLESIQSVVRLLELHTWLRCRWFDRRDHLDW